MAARIFGYTGALALERPSSRREGLLAVGLPAALYLLVMGRAGIWDPYELGVADLARRAAIHLFGASNLELVGAENRLPTLGDVGRGELPITSMALSFKLFGLNATAGRLPLTLFAIAGLAIVWLWMRRFVSARAGTYATLVLATMPLFFVQARTMLGDVVTMVAVLAAFAGLSVAALDPRPARASDAPWWLLGLGGLAVGFACRGAILGVAVPALSVGLAWLVLRGHAATSRPVVGVGLALLGVGFAIKGMLAMQPSSAPPGVPALFDRFLGGAVVVGQKYPTFDLVVMHLGHSLFPWSALLPLALGRLFAPPPVVEAPGDDEAAAAVERESRVRLLVLVGAGVCFAGHALLAPRIGYVPFTGVALLACAMGLVLYDFERGAHPSRALVLATALLAMVLFLDFSRMPEKGLSVFAVANASFPEAFKPAAERLVRACAAVFLVPLFFAFLDPESPAPSDRDEPLLSRLVAHEDMRAILEKLNLVWQGNLTFVAVMLEAMLVGFAALIFVGDRFHLKVALRESLNAELKVIVLNAWWALPALAVGGPFVLLTARKLFLAALALTGIRRGQVALAGGVAAGLVLSVGYYPALASQLSPKEVFDAYRKLRKDPEPLGLLGVATRSASYYTGGSVRPFTEVNSAFEWLTEGNDRRWLAVRGEDLPRLNSLFRGKVREAAGLATPDHNLPVLDARSSQVLLVSNRLGAGETNESPLAKWFSAATPTPRHRVDVNLDDQLQALGWDVFDGKDEKQVDVVVPGKAYVLHLYYRVTSNVLTQWKSFIHIDGFGRRFNGDHDVFEGKVPMSLWQPGDIVTDRFDFKLEPNFTPGNYTLFYGFFIGERRLAVKSGRHHENRVDGGAFPVR